MEWLSNLFQYLNKPKATKDDLYNQLSYHDWKYGMQMLKELETKGLRARHMRGVMYVHLQLWGEQGLVESRLEDLEGATHRMPRRQYRKKPGGKKVVDEEVGGLEMNLGFA